MTKFEETARELINDYYSRPSTQDKIQFCKSRNIKAYQLDRMIELYGQRLVPGLCSIGKTLSKPTVTGKRYDTIDGLCREASQLIEVELSDRERVTRDERVRGCTIPFQRLRMRLLVEIAMMAPTSAGHARLLKMEREASHE